MKWFICQLLDPKGCISAPQTVGFMLSLFCCVLALLSPLFPIYKELIIPILSAAGTLLVGGSFEVYTQKRWGDKI